MAKRKSIFRRIRLVYKRSSTAAKIVMLLAIVLSTVALLIMGAAIREANIREEKARLEAQAEEQRKEDLQNKVDGLGSLDSIEDIAKDELGLVDPDTVIITPNSTPGGDDETDRSPVSGLVWALCIGAVLIAVPAVILIVRKKRNPESPVQED